MAPLPNDEHQHIVGELDTILRISIAWRGLGEVRPGVNISDRVDDGTTNFRIPDVAVFLNEGTAKNHGAFWHGGPDFLIEIASPNDNPREKLPFYAKIGTREVLIVDREPWSIELLRLGENELVSIGISTASHSQILASTVVPFTFRLIEGSPRPKIEVAATQSGQAWSV